VYHQIRGVKEGWPLTPYLFCIVKEVLNFMFREAIKLGDIKKITMMGGTMQQIIS
jgi:hypothetical protein